ncbi:MAG: HNH endonuclease [Ignavibacteria bacterium]
MNQNWKRQELIVAFNLYCKTPFTKINSSNKGVIELSNIIGRSASAVALKLANFARLDPALKSRKISGMKHGSKGEEEIWNEFNDDWEKLAFESEKILANYKGIPIEKSSNIDVTDIIKEGKDRDVIVRARVNQQFFRQMILSSYNQKCCITEISIPSLLVASHIIPWSINKELRMNPQNGLCMNSLHDKAFDLGLITIGDDYNLVLSKELLGCCSKEWYNSYFLPFKDKPIKMPQRFIPEKEYLRYHMENIFIK